jgi:hypothetical protein
LILKVVIETGAETTPLGSWLPIKTPIAAAVTPTIAEVLMRKLVLYKDQANPSVVKVQNRM